MRLRVLLVPTMIVIGLAPYAALFAQTEQIKEQGKLEEVLVTAQRREEAVRDVPIAISVLSQQAIESMGAESFVDFARAVPGLQFRDAGPGRVKLSIRGISSGTGAATVGYYIDDVPLPTNNGFINLVTIDPNLFDIQRIEVLRGPQGTLYGAGSMGGTVKYVMNRPDSTKFGSRIMLTGSGTTHGGPNAGIDALVNAPLITDQLAFRLVGFYHYNDGFIDRIYGPPPSVFYKDNDLINRTRNTANERTSGARGVLEYKPTDRFRFTLSAFHQSTDMNGLRYVTGPPSNPNMFLQFRQPLNVEEPYSDQFNLYDFTASLDLGKLNLTAIASHFIRLFNMVEDGTIHLTRFFYAPLGGPILPGPLEEITNQSSNTYEARLSTVDPLYGFHFLVGFFSQHRTPLRWANWVVPGANAAYQPLGLPLPGDNFYTNQTHATEDETAVFGEVSYQVTERFKATAGLRHFNLKSSSDSVFNGLFGNGGATSTTHFASDKNNAKFALTWEPSRDATLYATAAQGLRPGTGVGFLPHLCDADLIALGLDPNRPPTQVNPDSVWSYEVGAKTAWLGRRIEANAALFDIEWKDIQQTVFLQCGFNILANAGKARSKGVELESDISPTDRFELSVAFTYQDAALVQDTPPSVGGKKGDRIQDVPKIQFGGAAQYHWPIMQGYNGFLRADVQYTGLSYVNFLQTIPEYTKPGYTLVNLRAGVDIPSTWRVTLFVDNLFNKLALLDLPDSLIFNLADLPRYTVNRPRTVGITATKAF